MYSRDVRARLQYCTRTTVRVALSRPPPGVPPNLPKLESGQLATTGFPSHEWQQDISLSLAHHLSEIPVIRYNYLSEIVLERAVC